MLANLQIAGKDLLSMGKIIYWNQNAAIKIANDEGHYGSIKRRMRKRCVISQDMFFLLNIVKLTFKTQE